MHPPSNFKLHLVASTVKLALSDQLWAPKQWSLNTDGHLIVALSTMTNTEVATAQFQVVCYKLPFYNSQLA